MGRIKKGILGGFSGKVGSVVGASWKSIDYMRGLPKVSEKPATKAQLGQRCKFTLFRGFLIVIGDLVEKGYQNHGKYTAMNGALSYNMLKSVKGTCPEFEIDLPNLLYTRGDLFGVWTPKAVSKESASLEFSWVNGPSMPLCAADDEVTLLVYSTELKKIIFFKSAGVRQDGGAKLLLPKDLSGSKVHCYLNFFSADGKLSSTNQYLGEAKVI